MLKVEALTKNGKLVAYEAVVKTGTNNSELRLARTGKSAVSGMSNRGWSDPDGQNPKISV